MLAAFVALASLSLPVRPASAHFCANPVRIPLRQPSTVTIGVDSDGAAPVTEVDVVVPDELTVERALDTPPWTSTRTGDTITYTGGEIAIGTCTFFSLNVIAPRKGVVAVPVITRAADGAVREFRGRDISKPFPAQLVYAGIPIPQIDVSSEDSQDSGPLVLGVGLVVVGLGGLGFMLWRNGVIGGGATAARTGPRSRGKRPPPRSRKRSKPGRR